MRKRNAFTILEQAVTAVPEFETMLKKPVKTAEPYVIVTTVAATGFRVLVHFQTY